MWLIKIFVEVFQLYSTEIKRLKRSDNFPSFIFLGVFFVIIDPHLFIHELLLLMSSLRFFMLLLEINTRI